MFGVGATLVYLVYCGFSLFVHIHETMCLNSRMLPLLPPQMCRSGQQSGKQGQDLGEEARYLGHKNLRRPWLSGANRTLTDPESQGFLKFLCPRCLDCLTQVLGLQENQPLADLGVRTRRERDRRWRRVNIKKNK